MNQVSAKNKEKKNKKRQLQNTLSNCFFKAMFSLVLWSRLRTCESEPRCINLIHFKDLKMIDNYTVYRLICISPVYSLGVHCNLIFDNAGSE